MGYIEKFTSVADYNAFKNSSNYMQPNVSLITPINKPPILKYDSDLDVFLIDNKMYRGFGYWYFWLESEYNTLGLQMLDSNTIVNSTNSAILCKQPSGTPVKPGTLVPQEGGVPIIQNGDDIISGGSYILVANNSTTAPSISPS